jgi:MFS family permease
MLVLLAVAELLGMATWFTGSAIAPSLAEQWSLGAGAAGWLSTAVQLGFVAGTAAAAVLNLADTIPSRAYFTSGALLAGTFNLLLISAPNFEFALASRFLTGAALAAVYPPAMKMIATWFADRRGIAIGTIVGALTAGKALPYLLRALPDASTTSVLTGASGAAFLAASLVAILYRDGPVPFPRRPFSWSLAASVLRTREYRLVLGGYLGHMWELYAYWVWIPTFLAASLAGQDVSPAMVSVLAFLSIAVGAIGCIWGGAIADRIGYARLVTVAMLASGTCALLTPLVFGKSAMFVTVLVLIWGITVIADSAQFSTLVTRVVEPHAVGTALTLQTSIGFLLTTISIQTIPPIVDAVGWRWAFPMLAVGPMLGVLAIRRMRVAARAGH